MKTCSKAQMLRENNGPASRKDFGGYCKVETQSLLRQNKYLIWCCLYLSHLKLRFYAPFVPSSPHLASDLHQKKPAKLPSSLPQQHPDEGLHSVLWPVTLCSSDQEGRPVSNRIFFCCSFISCCNFLAISALPFFVLSLSYFETGTGSGCAVHRNHAGYPPSSGESFHQEQIIITVIFWKILPFHPNSFLCRQWTFLKRSYISEIHWRLLES